MPFTQPTTISSSPPAYSTPSSSDLAAVAATVAVVGVLMAILLTWLVLRLRRASDAQSQTIPVSPSRSSSSFAPSEKAPFNFGFIRKSVRLSHRREDGSWDFADPDPFYSKDLPLDVPPSSPSSKHRPTPLTSVPAYTPRAHRASTHKYELGPRTPTTPGTPASIDLMEPPPPAYCPYSSPRLPYQPGVPPPS